MEFFEIRAIMKNRFYAYKESWEQARFVAYLIAQVNSKKKLKLADIIEFPWEIDSKETEDNTEISKEDIDRLRKESSELQKNINI